MKTKVKISIVGIYNNKKLDVAMLFINNKDYFFDHSFDITEEEIILNAREQLLKVKK